MTRMGDTMRFWMLLGAFCILLLNVSCADVTEIKDGKKYGPVIAIQDWFTSCSLLKTKNAVVLFDACFQEGTLKDGLKKQGLTPQDVTHVLITHGHRDHVGGLKLLTNAKVMALADEQPVLTEHAKEAGKIDEILQDGQTLTFDDVKVKVFAVKGHTPGSAVYLVEGTLVMGDTALITSQGKLQPVGEDRSADPEQAIQSLIELDARLTKEGHVIKWILPAHSGGIEGQGPLTTFAKAASK